jgi:hypothetical protein
VYACTRSEAWGMSVEQVTCGGAPLWEKCYAHDSMARGNESHSDMVSVRRERR